MSPIELDALHDRLWRRILWLNGFWVAFILVMIFLWFPAGIVLAVLTALKYWYDYHDTESQDIYHAFLSLIEHKRTKESISDD